MSWISCILDQVTTALIVLTFSLKKKKVFLDWKNNERAVCMREFQV